MSLGVWMGSESVWECTYLYQICWQRNHIRSWHSDIVFYSCALYCIKTPMPGGVCIVSAGCLDCVCGVSGWCLWVSGSYLGVCGRCLGEYRCHINHKQLNRSCHIKLLPFLHSQKVLNFGVSVGCLEGVWTVSGGCFGDSGDSGYCLVYWLSNTNLIWS